MAKRFAIEITIDHKSHCRTHPTDHQLRQWATAVLASYRPNTLMAIRLVDEKESAALNWQYRQKTGPTNILSFCFEPPSGMESNILGDMILCPALIAQEISTQPFEKNALEAHWAHLIVHGCLHLIGYHHDDATSTHQMEQLEINHLATLGYPNPYE